MAPALDLWPVVPKISLSGRGQELSLRGKFSRTTSAAPRRRPDLLGLLTAWDNIHLVDASVFPIVPATTFTLTIMANAHRIASETLAAAP